jgi:hypothetical protein
MAGNFFPGEKCDDLVVGLRGTCILSIAITLSLYRGVGEVDQIYCLQAVTGNEFQKIAPYIAFMK